MATTYVVTNDKSTFLSGVGFAWPLVTNDADIAGAESGDLIVWNGRAGIALTDYADGEVMVDWAGSYEIEVNCEDGAIEIMQPVYYDAAEDEVNDDDAGIFVGLALEAIASSSATIGVKFLLTEGAV